jgi:hypothetical protein
MSITQLSEDTASPCCHTKALNLYYAKVCFVTISISPEFDASVLITLSIVLTVYSKGGRNHGKHGYVDNIGTITMASNIVIQVFQYHFGSHFYDKPHMNHLFPQLQCFDIIPSTLFLCALQSSPVVPVDGQPGIEVSPQDITLFKILQKKQKDIEKAIKVFNKWNGSSTAPTGPANCDLKKEIGDT